VSTLVSCNLCGADDYKVLCTPKTTDGPVVQCRACGLVYVNPRLKGYLFDGPDSSEWLEEYQALVEKFHMISPDQAEDSERTKRQCFRDRLRRIRAMKGDGRLLDVGCATGIFLDMARAQGFQVFGVEPTPYLAAEASARLGLDVYAGTLERANLPALSFDVVTLFHVIEHVSSPLNLLTEVHRILKPGGLLCLETPSVDGLWFRIMDSHWRQYIRDH
jgi:2-polyprenyl-3-methyl-5-hydroxy-6-metoxy-1,4-benzoquinol methylase